VNVVNAVFDFIDTRYVIRRLVLAWVIWMTTAAFFWTFEFATASSRSGVDVAAIIAAIWAPLTALQGAVIAFYNSGRANAAPPPVPQLGAQP
jgi:hypothetical protein